MSTCGDTAIVFSIRVSEEQLWVLLYTKTRVEMLQRFNTSRITILV